MLVTDCIGDANVVLHADVVLTQLSKHADSLRDAHLVAGILHGIHLQERCWQFLRNLRISPRESANTNHAIHTGIS